MPLHDFKCDSCGKIFEVFHSLSEMKEIEICPNCRNQSRKTFECFFDNNHGGIRVFKPGWFEHIAPEPIFIESREQLKSECKKHNVYSQYIEDSYNR